MSGQFTVLYHSIPKFPSHRVLRTGSVWSSLSGQWRILKPLKVKGYFRVVLNPGYSRRFVHHLVLEAFVGPKPPGMECRHFPDANRANNRLDNLQWGTRKQNTKDRLFHGTTTCGTKQWKAVLDDDLVVLLRKEYAGGMGVKKLAAKHGLNRHTVSYAVRRMTWKHVN